MDHGVFLDSGTFGDDGVEFAALEATLPRWTFHAMTPPVEVAARIRDASVVVTNKVVLDQQHLAAADKLRLICVSATGVNNVDLGAAARRGITVCNVPAYATQSVAQHVFALMFSLTTHLIDYQRAVSEGRWRRSPHFCLLDYPIHELCGRRLGIVGFGELGRAVAAAAGCFGMTVSIAARRGAAAAADRVPFDELLQSVDVLSLHCPLTDSTRNLIGARELGLMKPGAILINTARGGIVDEAALAAALRGGIIAGAGVDVLDGEPPSGDSPLLAPDIPNLIVTPHVAWASREARQRLIDRLAENIRAFLAGKPRNVVS